MKDLFVGMKLGCVLGTLLLLAVLAVSWLITCGLIALICLIFSWEFSWLIATGIWLLALAVRSLFYK